jgi:hypothetical protein
MLAVSWASRSRPSWSMPDLTELFPGGADEAVEEPERDRSALQVGSLNMNDEREPRMVVAADDGPSWDLYRRMADSPLVTPARRHATLWALDQLERSMGHDWLQRYWRAAGHVPEEVNLGGPHVAALGGLLELGLRLRLLAGSPGLGGVQKEMRSDLRDDRRRHAALQLEVGGLAMRAGAAVALETRASRDLPPSDVLMQWDEVGLRVETFAIILDKSSREGRAYWDRITQAIMWINAKFDVNVTGDLGGPLDDDDAAELLQLIEAAAQAVSETGQGRPVVFSQADLQVLPSRATAGELRGGVETSRGWPRVQARLRQKAAQSARAGGGWLRADLMDGTWQFTPWARASLHQKVGELSKMVKQALAQVDGVSGIVMSSGACVAQGQFLGLSTRTVDRSYGFVRPLPGHRVRETMIIPVTAAGRSESDMWADLYNAEDSWPNWALGQEGLPSCLQIFG